MDKKTMQNISEASAAKWKRLHELEAENARLREAALAVLDNAAIDAYEAAQPDTHVLVPREPTEAMIGAAERIGYHSHRSDFIRREIEREYKAMIAAHEEVDKSGE